MNTSRNSVHKKLKKKTIAMVLGLLTSNHLSYGATFVVDRGIDGSIGCTLRNALNIINEDSGTSPSLCINRSSNVLGINDTILFSVSSVSGINSPLQVNKCVNINPDGNRVRLIGTGDSSIMEISSDICNTSDEQINSDVKLNNMSFSGGDAGDGRGGALRVLNSDVIINHSVFDDNAASLGGAISLSDSTLILNNSVVNNNSSSGNGGGVYVRNRSTISTLVINNTRVTNNRSETTGGGLYLAGSSLISNNSEISENAAHFFAGAIYTSGAISLNHTSVTGNQTDDLLGASGGGIRADSSNEFNCNFSTISENFAPTGGGAIINATRSMTFNACIVAGNSADSGDEIYVRGHEIPRFTGASNLFGESSKHSSDAFVGFIPRDSDIIATSDGDTPTSLASILLPLAENGGATRTHALPKNSPAIDRITGSACTALNPQTDQRGSDRPSGTACDIGAYEYQQEESSFYVIPVGNGKSVIINL